MITRTLLVLLTIIFSQTYAQKAKVTANLNFIGTVGKYPIEMKLSLNNYNDSISGEYYYVRSGRDNRVYLEGTLKNGELLLKESAYNTKLRRFETTGYFRILYSTQTSLTGSWAKKSANTANSLAVRLQCRENLQAFNPLGFDFIMVKNRPNYDNVTANAARYYTLLSLKINVSKSTKWVLHEFDPQDLVNDEVELEDVNFDSYLDIKVPIYYPDLAKNDYSYVYFVNDVKTKGFQKDKTLNDLGVLFFDAPNKQVYKYDADGSGNEGTMYYRWQNGKLFLVKSERVYENDTYTHYEEYKIENGKSIKVKRYKKK